MFAQTGNGGNDSPIPFKVINTGGQHDPFPKSPIQIPEVYLNGDTLTFDNTIEGCEVRLLDANENVIFTDSIEENQTDLTFPSSLSGTYELQIICGSITFYCYIEL